jgi:hypothetical protein
MREIQCSSFDPEIGLLRIIVVSPQSLEANADLFLLLSFIIHLVRATVSRGYKGHHTVTAHKYKV